MLRIGHPFKNISMINPNTCIHIAFKTFAFLRHYIISRLNPKYCTVVKFQTTFQSRLCHIGCLYQRLCVDTSFRKLWRKLNECSKVPKPILAYGNKLISIGHHFEIHTTAKWCRGYKDKRIINSQSSMGWVGSFFPSFSEWLGSTYFLSRMRLQLW